MSTIIGFVSSPTKHSQVPSNCKVSVEGSRVVLSDDTSSRVFVQKQEFNTVIESDNFTPVIDKVNSGGSVRVISFGSEYSTPTIPQIKEWSIQFIHGRYPKNNSTSIPVAAGLVYDKDLLDFLALKSGRSENFEFVETTTVYDAEDLIDFSFERFRRFKESVFVLHVGNEPFFEWIVVPRVDAFVPTPSIAGLPPNEKLIFILKQFPSIPDAGIERFRKMSNAFKIISDSFADVQTYWICHLAKDVTLKSNAALFRIVNYISDALKNGKHSIPRSQLFVNRPPDPVYNDPDFTDAISETHLNDVQRREAQREERQLNRELRLGNFKDSDYSDNYNDDDDYDNFQGRGNGSARRSPQFKKFGLDTSSSTFGSDSDDELNNKRRDKDGASRTSKNSRSPSRKGGKSARSGKGGNLSADEDDNKSSKNSKGGKGASPGSMKGKGQDDNSNDEADNKMPEFYRALNNGEFSITDDSESDDESDDESKQRKNRILNRKAGGSDKKKRRRKHHNDKNKMQIDASKAVTDDNLEEEDMEALRQKQQDDEIAAMRANRKTPKKKKKRKAAASPKESENEKSKKKDKADDEENEEAVNEEAVNEEARMKIQAFKERRRQKLKEKQEKEKAKQEKKKKAGDEQSNQNEKLSPKERFLRKMKQLQSRQAALNEDEYEYEEEEEEEDQKKAAAKKRQKLQRQYFKYQALAYEATRKAKDNNSEMDELYNLDEKVLNKIDKLEERRKLRETDIMKLKTKLSEKKKQHESNLEEIKDIRSSFLKLHEENVQKRTARAANNKCMQIRGPKNPEYERAKKLLELEILRVQNEIKEIKRRI